MKTSLAMAAITFAFALFLQDPADNTWHYTRTEQTLDDCHEYGLTMASIMRARGSIVKSIMCKDTVTSKRYYFDPYPK